MKPPGKSAIFSVMLALALIATGPVTAHPGHEPLAANQAAPTQAGKPAPDAVDAQTQSIFGLTGPTRTHGVVGIEELGIIDLGEEFRAMQGRRMRARIFTIAPGGVIGIHAHEQRPGYAMILSGSIVEHRSDTPAPIVRNVGDIAIEKGGVAHWWENVSHDPVRALVVDIVAAD